MTRRPDLAAMLRGVLPRDRVRDDLATRLALESDGLPLYREQPDVVLLDIDVMVGEERGESDESCIDRFARPEVIEHLRRDRVLARAGLRAAPLPAPTPLTAPSPTGRRAAPPALRFGKRRGLFPTLRGGGLAHGRFGACRQPFASEPRRR